MLHYVRAHVLLACAGICRIFPGPPCLTCTGTATAAYAGCLLAAKNAYEICLKGCNHTNGGGAGGEW